VEWQLTDDGTWLQVDDLKEIDALLAAMLAMTAENRRQIVAARTLMQRVRRLLLLRDAARSWPTPSWRVH